jgi:hypothetical protein
MLSGSPPPIYVDHIREGLHELACGDLQRAVWVDPDDPRIGSFVEAICEVWDDSGLSVELEKRPEVVLQMLGPEVVQLLEQLSRACQAMDHHLDPATLVASPEMDNVRRLAAAALDALNAE